MDPSQFHADEIAAQSLAHAHPHAGGIRNFMPDQHRQFFPLLRYVFVSVPAESGWPVATVLDGPVGFVHAPSPALLRVDALPRSSDPAAVGFSRGNQIGVLGLDLATRRRNRANGRISDIGDDGFSIDVAESFGNCAQYIQTRTIDSTRPSAADETVTIDGLDGDARRIIRAADTFFVASRSRATLSRGGMDISHRGGRPGFVSVDGDRLTIPDFKGNRYFNTLGNLLGDNRAGLLFMDFETGDLVQAVGTVTIQWEPDTALMPTGTQRLWHVDIMRSWRRPRALPFLWAFGAHAPTTLATGVW